jgi:hypothetical protein
MNRIELLRACLPFPRCRCRYMRLAAPKRIASTSRQTSTSAACGSEDPRTSQRQPYLGGSRRAATRPRPGLLGIQDTQPR